MIALWWILGELFLGQTHASSPARSFLQENRLEEPIVICRQYEVLSTQDADNFLACAWAYYRADRPESAERMLDLAKRHADLPEYQLLLGFGKMRKKQYEEARKIFNQVAQDHRGARIGTTAQELSAELYEALGQIDTAAFIYKQVVAEDATRGRAHWGLGRYYLGKADHRRAVDHLQKTAKLWPIHVASRFNLGALYLTMDNPTEAARWLTEAYKLDKSDAGVLEQLGIVFEKRGNLREAVKWWQKTLEIKPESPIAREKLENNLAEVLDQMIDRKQFAEALKKVEARGENLSGQPKLLFRRGLLYRQTGKYTKASMDLANYLATQPNEPVAIRELGIAYLNLKEKEKAVAQFQRAVAQKPEDGLNYAWLGLALEIKGDLLRSRDAWKKAVDLLKDPQELEKASRRLSAIEQKLREKIK